MLFVLFFGLFENINGYNNGVGKLPFMGWNTWCTSSACEYDVCNSNEIKQIANAILTNGMYDAGYRYINLDDCWLACNRTANGSLYAEPTRFPDGMPAMIEYIHNLPTKLDKLKFGLYTDIGTHTCSGGHRDNCSPPGCYGHYQQDTITLANWNVDFIKLDGCSKPSNESWQNLNTQFSVAVNNTNRHILLELDQTYDLPAPMYIRDIAQTFKIVTDHWDEWSSTVKVINYIIAQNISVLSEPYGWAYFDFLMTGGQGCTDYYDNNQYLHCPGQTDTEYMSEFAIFAIGGSPLIVATDIRNMTDIMKKVLLNTEIINVNQQLMPPGNLLYYWTCDSSTENVCQVWTRKLSDGSIAVMALNLDDNESHGINIDFSKLNMNWSSNSIVNIRDLWQHKNIGNFTGNYEPQVVSHGNFFGQLMLVK